MFLLSFILYVLIALSGYSLSRLQECSNKISCQLHLEIDSYYTLRLLQASCCITITIAAAAAAVYVLSVKLRDLLDQLISQHS